MKNKIFSLVIMAILFPIAVIAQVTLNAESGNIGVDAGNCWKFEGMSYISSAGDVISGTFSLRSGQINNHSITNTYLKTPWMKIGTGNITFKIKLSSGSAPQSRGIRVSYIPYNASSPTTSYEGTAVTFHSYDYANVSDLSVKEISVPIPAAIENSTVVYRIMVSFVGQTGSGRILSDDYVFPGIYWSNPSNSCNPLPLVAPPADADGDGVPDVDDEYPNDPYRAHNTYFPAFSQFGTLAFEDNWPKKGDYDFNDVVVDYNIKTVTNGNGNVVEVIFSFILRASGAVYNNGFGVQLDGIAPNKVSMVTGNHPGSLPSAANKTESGQSYANVIVFDNFFSLMTRPGVGLGVNTDIAGPYITPVTQQVVIKFIDNGVAPPGGTLTLAQLSSAVYNFYIFINRERGREVHLPDRSPTSLANTSLFGTLEDSSNPVAGRYYKTINNLPWAINIVEGFEYTIEKIAIDQGYLHFIDWATSAGVQYPDWFMNKPGYRVPEKIY